LTTRAAERDRSEPIITREGPNRTETLHCVGRAVEWAPHWELYSSINDPRNGPFSCQKNLIMSTLCTRVGVAYIVADSPATSPAPFPRIKRAEYTTHNIPRQ